jgi:hypothetical protein
MKLKTVLALAGVLLMFSLIGTQVSAQGGKNTLRQGVLVPCDTNVDELSNCINEAGYDPEDCDIINASAQSGFVIVKCDG